MAEIIKFHEHKATGYTVCESLRNRKIDFVKNFSRKSRNFAYFDHGKMEKL